MFTSYILYLCSSVSVYLCVLGSEHYSEESSVRMVLCWVTPTRKNHLAFPLRDPSEDQPVRSLLHV